VRASPLAFLPLLTWWFSLADRRDNEFVIGSCQKEVMVMVMGVFVVCAGSLHLVFNFSGVQFCVNSEFAPLFFFLESTYEAGTLAQIRVKSKIECDLIV
jgi:hypothetical protein